MTTELPTLLRVKEVTKRTGLSRTHIYKLVHAGSFPPPVKLSAQASGWLESEVHAWVLQRIAERDARGGKRSRGRPPKNPWLAPTAV